MKILEVACRVLTRSNVSKPYTFLLVKKYFRQDGRTYGHAAVNLYLPVGTPVIPKLTPDAVNEVLQKNEVKVKLNPGISVVNSYCSNQLASNSPIEDQRAEAQCCLTDGVLVGVFDGHSGPKCAQVVSERLFDYIAAEILPYDTLLSVYKKIEAKETSLVRWLGGKAIPISPNAELHHHSLVKYLYENVSVDSEADDYIPDMMATAFDRLDQDLTTEALSHSDDISVNDECLRTVFSGACANVAFFQGNDLYVANSGDCRAVLGVQMDNGVWSPIVLSNDHNAYNNNEVNRVKSSHPANESMTVIRQERLLGELMPLRAFGDARFKWQGEIQKDIFRKWEKQHGPQLRNFHLPRNFYTPPYLVPTPEVTHYNLEGKTGFLILATDGLWEMLDPDKAVALVGAHSEAMGQMGPYSPAAKVTLGEIRTALAQRRFSLRPLDTNVSTHLIRYALCGVGHTFDYDKLAESVSLPPNIVRHYRDDITVTVVFFNGKQ